MWQYRTNQGAVSAHSVSQQLQNVPVPHTRTRSNFPHVYRNQEGAVGNTTQPFNNYVTGPGRANGPAGQLQKYPIPTPGEPFHFHYGERTINAHQARREIHPNERASVMGPPGGKPRNDPKQRRAVSSALLRWREGRRASPWSECWTTLRERHSDCRGRPWSHLVVRGDRRRPGRLTRRDGRGPIRRAVWTLSLWRGSRRSIKG